MVKTPKNEIPPFAPEEPEHVLPSDPVLESLILGAIMLQGSDTFDQAAGILTPWDFSNDITRTLWMRLAAMREAGEDIDRITLSRALTAAGELGKVGGLSALADLGASLPEIPKVESYCLRVKDKSHRRRLMFAAQAMLEAAGNEGSPVEDIVASAAATLDQIQTVRVEDNGRTPQQIVDDFPGGPVAFLDASLRKKGLPTSFTKFDEMTAGLQDGELIILGARPSMGKTALALNIAAHLTLHPKLRRPVSMFSLETMGPSLVTRILCSQARVDAHKFRLGFLNQEERHRLHVTLYDIMQSRLKIYDKFGITMPEISKHVRHDVKEHGTCLVVVDYLQLIGVKKKGENRNLDVSDMSRQFKTLAGECGIPILVLSQLSRANEKRTGSAQRPQLSDLRDSGAIEQDADVVMFIHREEVYKKDREDVRGQADLILAKQRNGPIGDVPLRYLGQFTRFENRSEDLTESQPEEM